MDDPYACMTPADTPSGDRCRPMAPSEFEASLRAKGAATTSTIRSTMPDAGRASREQIRGWVANRFYYQITIPIKDAAVLANCPDREVRREWVQRILDHDGDARRARAASKPGCAWARPSGWTARKSSSQELVLPGVRFAVDAYVNFARRACGRKRCARR